jgi:hypothetical protein
VLRRARRQLGEKVALFFPYCWVKAAVVYFFFLFFVVVAAAVPGC